MNDVYKIVAWPESQTLMEMDGFEENSYPILDEQGLADFGGSAYFVSVKWLEDNFGEE